DATSNVFSIKTNVDSSNKSTESESVPSLQKSIEIAQSALASSGISGQTELTYSSHTEDVLGGESGVQTVLNRKIKFKQFLAGFQSLSQAGSVEVMIGKGGIVNEITGSLLAVEDQTSSNFQVADANSNLSSMSSKALDAIAKKHPGAQYQIVDQKIGYDAGNFFELKSNAKAVAEFTIEDLSKKSISSILAFEVTETSE
ncbi:MAG: hypothetical protein NT027_05960, partial [Proteobacteria bacterium]|nr:hypothetical protein [Pseudomonadota bacterium]